MEQNLAYYDQVNSDLLDRIPATSKFILEVGCGSGALGQAYKTFNPNCRYFGVEMIEAPSKIAETRLDKVWHCNIEDKDSFSQFEGLSNLDAIIYGDVLEHLREPHYIVKKHREWLSPNGIVLACIPNVQHWSVLMNLLTGQWPQTDQGIFDRTHLRWFTRKSLDDLFEAADLKIIDIHPRIFQIEKAKAFVNTLASSLSALNINYEQLLQGCAPLQYVVVAASKPPSPLLVSGLMMNPQAGMNEVRMINPLRSLATTPGVRVELSSNTLGLTPASSELPRVMILQRQTITLETINQIKKLVNSGYIVVSEFDDQPEHFSDITANEYLTFSAVHAVQVSTSQIRHSIQRFNPEVVVFENCIDRLPPFHESKWSKDFEVSRLKIFFGALNREMDWAEWMPDLNNLLSTSSDKFDFEIIYDRKFFDQLETPHKRFTSLCNYNKYNEILHSCHISLMPLRPTSFNNMKSDLKYIEASAHSVATIASPTVYGCVIKPGVNGEIASDSDSLRQVLIRWSDNPSLAMSCSQNAYKYVKSSRLQSDQTQQRLDWYRSLWERRDALNQSLFARTPELSLN